MQRKIEALRRKFGVIPRALCVALVLLLLASVVFSMMLTLRLVTVVDTHGERHTLLTASERPEEIVKMVGLTTSRNDEVVYTATAAGVANVLIRRAFPVTLLADGSVYSAEFVDGTVADLLNAVGVRLGEEDLIEPALNTPLAKGMAVEIKRVTFADEVRREVLEQDVVEAYKLTLPADSGFVESHNATYDVTYRNRYVEGLLVSSEMVEMIPLVQPRPADSFVITKGVPCSRIEGFDDVEMGADGLPVNYTRLMESAVCTAYSSSGGRGASGLGLYCGTVAVNPNVIPYGTRMYITSADGSFIYGFAIATDTGGAMMEGRVDIDLYFETNAECLQFGKRALNVYILD